MNTQLIKTQNNYLLTNRENIDKEDWYFDRILGVIRAEFKSVSPLPRIIATRNIDLTIARKADESKLFCEIPNKLPSVDLSELSEETCKRIGYVDVEKLAEHSSEMQEGTYTVQHKTTYKHGFEDGFQKCQSLNDKMFSLENILVAINLSKNLGKSTEEIIQSLQQNVWNVEVEMEEVKCSQYGCGNSECLGYCINTKVRPKITNNSIRVVKIL